MKCCKCYVDLPEKEIQLSHDVPRYIGGLDKDGRHWLCKKCHDIYERLVFSIMVRNLSEVTKQEMREKAKVFARRYFKGEDDGDASV